MSSELHSAMAAIVTVMQFAKGAIDARDWAKLSEVSAKFNDQIIKAQQAVIDAQGTQSDLVTQLAQAHKKVRELEATLADQARHHLEELAPGKFALRVELAGQVKEDRLLGSNSQPKHYACQRCFAITGKSVILQHYPPGDWYSAKYVCPACKTELEA